MIFFYNFAPTELPEIFVSVSTIILPLRGNYHLNFKFREATLW